MEEIEIEIRQYKIPQPYCKKCKNKFIIQTNSVQPEEEYEKPLILVYGICNKCNIICMQRIISFAKVEEKEQ